MGFAPFAVLLFTAAAAAPDAGAEAAPRVVEVSPGRAYPGDPVMITVAGVDVCPQGWLGDRPLHFYELPGGCRALIGLTVEEPAGELPIRISETADEPESEGPEPWGTLEVLPPNFPQRELKVASKFVAPPPALKKRMKQDQKAFDKAFTQPWSGPLFKDGFVWPRPDVVITAPFGDLRTFNGKKQSQHYGTDLDGKVGDPVHAANDGVVVMARENVASGNTVLVFHGADLFTAYFHLSRIDVKPGQKVKRGQLLGLVGKTGRVTGPHLHFSAKLGGLYVNPASLLKLDVAP